MSGSAPEILFLSSCKNFFQLSEIKSIVFLLHFPSQINSTKYQKLLKTCTCLVLGGCTCLVLGECTWSMGGGCTWSGGCTCLVPGGVLGLGGTCLVLGGVPGPGGLYLPGPGGCTWSWGCVPAWSGGCLFWGGVWSQGGVHGPGGGHAWSGTPPVNRMTHRCKNITLAKTSFRPVIMIVTHLEESD